MFVVTQRSGHDGSMDKITYITPQFAISGMPEPEDLARFAALGFKAVISNRPDGEEPGQLTGEEERAIVERAGMRFHHVPALKHDLFTDTTIDAMVRAVAAGDGPILAHCKSGLRSAILWAAASARGDKVDCVISALTRAGFELDFLRDDLQDIADRRPHAAEAPALDCAAASELPPREA
jgi:uncharacterized protein (TIGR01244 family)